MKLTTAQKILKIVGILTILGAICTIVLGGLAVFGTKSAVESDPSIMNGTDADNVGILVIGGIGLLVAGLINRVTGILSVLSSKNGKFAKTTFILTLVSVVYSVANSLANYSKEGFNTSNVISLVVELVLSILVCVAANTAKVAYAEGRQA